jgi:outer membrane protein TolC
MCRSRIARLVSRGVAYVSIVLAHPGVAAQAAREERGPILSLTAAVALAREQNRPLQAVRLDVDKAAHDVETMRARRRPSFDIKTLDGSLLAPLNFQFIKGSFGVFPTTGPIPPADTNSTTRPGFQAVLMASVAQPLSQLHRIGLGTSALELQQDVVREKVRAQEQTVVHNVKKLYYGIVQAEAQLAVQGEALAYYRELDRLIGQYVEQQVVLPTEQLSVQAGLARQEHQALTLRQSIATYREQLNALLGRNVDEPFTVTAPDLPLTVSLDLAAAETQALATRAEVRIAHLQERQTEFDWRATRAASIPEISLAVNYLGLYNFKMIPGNVAIAGIVGTWEPWDWGKKKREAESKHLIVRQASLAADEAERLVRVDVRSTLRNLETARSLLHVADLARAPLRERVRVALDRFKVDAALQRDVLQAQAAFAESEQQYQQALAGFWIARAEFERAIAEN